MKKGKIEVNQGLAKAMRKTYGNKTMLKRPLVQDLGSTVRISMEAKNIGAILDSLTRLHEKYGASYAHTVEVSALNDVATLPMPVNAYTPQNTEASYSFSAVTKLMENNKSSLAKSWLMFGAERYAGDEGSWTTEVSFSNNRVSIDGVISPVKNAEEAMKVIRKEASKEIKGASFNFAFMQCGLTMDRQLPMTKKFMASSDMSHTCGKKTLRTFTNRGLIKVSEIDEYLKELFKNSIKDVEEVFIYGSLVWGFDRGIGIHRREKNDGYTITIDIDSLGGTLQETVKKGLCETLLSIAGQ
jgi:hypothetical protein